MPLNVGDRLSDLGGLGFDRGFGVAEIKDVQCTLKEKTPSGHRMVFALKVGPEHINALQTMHGAFAMLLLDVLTTLTIMDLVMKPTVSVNMAGQYQGAAKLGDELVIDCRIEKAGKSLVYLSMTITTAAGKIVFTGQQTKMFLAASSKL
eukprot:Skav220550  [mRNA]  locus=scaffold761:113572:114018:- [translate_table: standard]